MLLSANNISKSFGEKELFKEGNFEVYQNDRIGLIGANGCGKTTIFKIICGEETTDTGSVIRQSGIKIGILSQFACKDSQNTCYNEALSIFSNLINTEIELAKLNQKLETDHSTSLIEKASALRERFERDGGLTYKARTRSALLGLGFREEELDLPITVLSGGQKSKIEICKLLLSSPDIMLLDEPTNHLDIDAIEWLDGFIKSSKSAVVTISHDRYFLDSVVNKIISIEHGKIYTYNGNYTKYLSLREHREQSIEKEYKNTMREVHRIEGIIKQQKQFNREKNIRTAESKQKQIDRLLSYLQIPESELETISLSFKAKNDTGNDVLRAENLNCAFGDKVLYKNINLDIKKGERIFILGKNGCGKTTLLRSLKNGNAQLGSGVSLGFFDQHAETLDENKTAYSYLRDTFPQKTETSLRAALALFLFKGDDVFREISTFSGGEKARVALCSLMLKQDNLLLLDEPTNHLDLASREILENALDDFEGTIIAVSHDRYFINKIANTIFYFDNGDLKRLDGNYEKYLEVKNTLTETKTLEKKQMGAGGISYKQKKEAEARKRKLKTAYSKCEAEIEELENKQKEIESSLSDPRVASNYEETTRLALLLNETKEKLNNAIDEWEALSEQLLEFEE